MHLLLFLSERIAAEHPSADADSAWPTSADVSAAIQQNPQYFPAGYNQLSQYRKVLQAKGWIEVGPCAAVVEAMRERPWHGPACEHWRLTVVGRNGLARLDKEGCNGGCKHRKLPAKYKIAA
jgi:hypothetical protein